MKTYALTLLLLCVKTSFSQDIVGEWTGVLKVGDNKLRLVFHVSQEEGSIKSTFDSPDQGAYNIPVSTTTYENKILRLSANSLGIEFEGTYSDQYGPKVEGFFKQSGQVLALSLTKKQNNEVQKGRYQEPEKPYPYTVEEVVFKNEKEGIALSGTLTLPKQQQKCPVVILIAGSGRQNRDEEVFGHRPFLILADFLTKKGIATLRFDKRGVNLSTGNFAGATTKDFSEDALCAFEYLMKRQEIDKSKIGLLGHSEGGLVASIIASHHKGVAFTVLLGTPALRGDRLLLLQQEKLQNASNFGAEYIEKSKAISTGAFEIVVRSTDVTQLKSELTNYFTRITSDSLNSLLFQHVTNREDFIKRQVEAISSPWMIYFLKYDPLPTIKKITCPILALNGDLDLQVPLVNLTILNDVLTTGKKNPATVKAMKNQNHLFQECKTGLPTEYGMIEQTMSPATLDEIAVWIASVVKK